MNYALILQAALIFFLGTGIGFAICKIRTKSKTQGSLIINQLDPDKDSYKFMMEVPMEDLPNYNTIALKVKVVRN